MTVWKLLLDFEPCLNSSKAHAPRGCPAQYLGKLNIINQTVWQRNFTFCQNLLLFCPVISYRSISVRVFEPWSLVIPIWVLDLPLHLTELFTKQRLHESPGNLCLVYGPDILLLGSFQVVRIMARPPTWPIIHFFSSFTLLTFPGK